MSQGFGQAPAPIEPGKAVAAASTITAEEKMARMQLEAQIRSGANWFYWIAGLSLVNTIAAISGSNWRFLLGLTITQSIDFVAKDLNGVGRLAGFVVDFFLAGMFVLLGVFAGKQQRWAFVVGMLLFGVDGILTFAAQDWIGVAFHGFALWMIFAGFQKIGRLRERAEFVQVGA